MPLYQKFSQEDALIGIWKVEESVEQLRAMLLRPFGYDDFLSRCLAGRRREWLAVRVLLKELCGEEKEIAYCLSGRPYLKDGSSYLSISHTKGYVAVVLHSSRQVGIDIEQYGSRVRRVVSRFIRFDEMIAMENRDDIYTLLLHWSAKETMFKLMSVEGVDFVRHLHVLPFSPAVEGCFYAREYRTPLQLSYCIHYLTHPEFVLTWGIEPV